LLLVDGWALVENREYAAHRLQMERDAAEGPREAQREIAKERQKARTASQVVRELLVEKQQRAKPKEP
jgi:hypothetical protein